MRILVLASLVVFSSCAKNRGAPALPEQRNGPPPAAALHLPPDASTAELRAAVEAVFPAPEDRPALLRRMESANKQVFAWQAAINAQRAPDKHIRFDREVKGIPIDAPFEYNAETVDKEFKDAIDALNPEMRAVIDDAAATPPAVITTDDTEFEKRCTKVIKAYDHAMRWESLAPYVSFYKTRAKNDVRGYYFLQKVEDLSSKLAHWRDLPAADAEKYSAWLVGLCRNGGTDVAVCARDLQLRKNAGDVRPFFDAHLPASRALFEWFFSLAEKRTDVTWFREASLSGPQVPFTRPERGELATLVKGLLEDAWKGAGWQLRVSYVDRADDDTAHLVFEAGALPHVNRLAGSEITMDDNVPADNELNKSVFQHEFGHVIGFPDCYVEFFDESSGKMINYQIDVNNIMCSRKGAVTDLHRDALRRAYMPAGEREPSSPRAHSRKARK